MRKLDRILLSLPLLALIAAPARSTAPYLVRDINPSSATASSEPYSFVSLQADGTANGTRLVRDVCRGGCSSWPSRLPPPHGAALPTPTAGGTAGIPR